MKKLDVVKDKAKKALPVCHNLAHKAEHPVHLLYFLAVSLTAHGAYAYVAAVCLVFGVLVMIPVGAVVVEEEEEGL